MVPEAAERTEERRPQAEGTGVQSPSPGGESWGCFSAPSSEQPHQLHSEAGSSRSTLTPLNAVTPFPVSKML